MRLQTCLLLALVVAPPFFSALGRTEPEPSKGEPTPSPCREVASTYAREGDFSGVVSVRTGGVTRCTEATGSADAAGRRAIRAETPFRIGSITKVLTSILVLRLVESGVVALDEPLGEAAPELSPELAAKITLRQLLTHTAGLTGPLDQPGLFEARSGTDLAQAVREGVLPSAAFEAGTGVAYSNAGLVVAGRALEVATGRGFADLLREMVLEPAGMESTSLLDSDDSVPIVGFAVGLNEMEPVSDSSVFGSPAGDLISTAEDLGRLGRALRSGALLSARSRDLLFGEGEVRTMTWRVREREAGTGPERVASVHGSAPGFTARWWHFLDRDLDVVALDNRESRSVYSGRIVEDLTRSLDREPIRGPNVAFFGARRLLAAAGPEAAAARVTSMAAGSGIPLLESLSPELSIERALVELHGMERSSELWQSFVAWIEEQPVR